MSFFFVVRIWRLDGIIIRVVSLLIFIFLLRVVNVDHFWCRASREVKFTEYVSHFALMGRGYPIGVVGHQCRRKGKSS